MFLVGTPVTKARFKGNLQDVVLSLVVWRTVDIHSFLCIAANIFLNLVHPLVKMLSSAKVVSLAVIRSPGSALFFPELLSIDFIQSTYQRHLSSFIDMEGLRQPSRNKRKRKKLLL